MLALGLKPGQGSIAVIGCTSLYAGVGMYVAANSIGVAFAVSFYHYHLPEEVAFCTWFSTLIEFSVTDSENISTTAPYTTYRL